MNILEVDQIAKSFGANRAVDGVSFHVAPGEIYGLLGPNGAGKTTAISIISGLLTPDSGSVHIDGAPYLEDPTASKRKMGVTPQEIALYDELSGLENLISWGQIAGLSSVASKTRAAEILGALDLADRGKDLVKTYSGGMKRRLNIGCSLLHQPKLLLLDEPTVGIDPQARARILEFVRNLTSEGVGVLYTTHYLEEAESLCDRIGIIDHGKLLAEGALQALRSELGGERLFTLEGNFSESTPESWPDFDSHFQILRQSHTSMTVAARTDEPAHDSLKRLLELPIHPENVIYKRPSLNEVFLHLTGRELRE